MWWYLVFVPFAIWVYKDGMQRRTNAAAWALGTAILGIVVLPAYFATRPLKKNEVREGGRAWIVVKNFALAWTVLIWAAGCYGVMQASMRSVELSSDAARTGATIGTVVGVGFLGAIWFFPMLGALVLGLFLKTSNVERGPTGPLAELPIAASRTIPPQKSAPAPAPPSQLWSVTIQRGFRKREELRSVLQELAPTSSDEQREQRLEQREILVASGLSLGEANQLMMRLAEKNFTAQKQPS